MNWIYIKDRRPEIDEEILAYYPNYYAKDKSSIQKIIYKDIDFDIDQYLSMGGSTHWLPMSDIPLPNQPERSKREDSDYCDCFKGCCERHKE